MFFSQRSEEIIGKSRMWNEANEVGAEMERKLSSNKFAEKVCRIFVVSTDQGFAIKICLPWVVPPPSDRGK